jgi:hypothetical protein
MARNQPWALGAGWRAPCIRPNADGPFLWGGREGMEVSSRRVSSTYAWSGRLSRSEMSSRAEVGCCGVTTGLLVFGLGSHD